jgi:DNA-binding PucR family transcriptional regulator
LVERGRHFGLELDRAYRVLAVRGEVTERKWPLFTASRLGVIVALVEEGAELPAVDEVAGLSAPAVGPRALADAIAEATRILSIGTSLRRTGVVTEADLGALSMLVDPRRTSTLRQQAARTLAPLLDYDAANDAELVATLKAYLEAQGRPSEAARRSYVHINTLYYRLDRIRTLTGWDLEDPDLRLHLHLACRVLDLTHDGLDDSYSS